MILVSNLMDIEHLGPGHQYLFCSICLYTFDGISLTSSLIASITEGHVPFYVPFYFSMFHIAMMFWNIMGVITIVLHQYQIGFTKGT